MTILKLLWLDDKILKKRGATFSKINISLGIGLIISSIAYYFAMTTKVGSLPQFSSIISGLLTKVPASEAESEVLMNSARALESLVELAAGGFHFQVGSMFFLGFILLIQGVLYSKVHRLLNEET